jgi:hypothetical protein
LIQSFSKSFLLLSGMGSRAIGYNKTDMVLPAPKFAQTFQLAVGEIFDWLKA